ncbi:class I SAM-dependent methyltransferase [Pseudoleptotrichia goodfellowii]|uniref:Type 11 methyltransferase n=1 Tax=Pseudoleptotrichia goodfellowii TaxID=157692 RepID=A0A510JAR2_9FUSO|nr:methyltransferase domain-containing protein [Pseudoleptotrichia goodfellowii]BBM36277.1 type 11 methyltransferase [Pseudoleptotrichia goodfellowii]
MIDKKIKEKFKANIDFQKLEEKKGIIIYLNDKYISGDNRKYMKMYNKLSAWYDFGEKWIGKFVYGNSVEKMRRDLMNHLEWKEGASILYVSIGTGKDLNYIPKNINLKLLDITGADISLGMLNKCNSVWKNKTNISLVNCCAEDLPFKDDTFDIVFHVGGINFFSDKEQAVREMLRVAKPGSKLMIADETADFIEKQYKKSIFTKKYYKNETVDLSEIEKCIPESVKDRSTELVWDKKFYCITFRK